MQPFICICRRYGERLNVGEKRRHDVRGRAQLAGLGARVGHLRQVLRRGHIQIDTQPVQAAVRRPPSQADVFSVILSEAQGEGPWKSARSDLVRSPLFFLFISRHSAFVLPRRDVALKNNDGVLSVLLFLPFLGYQ